MEKCLTPLPRPASGAGGGLPGSWLMVQRCGFFVAPIPVPCRNVGLESPSIVSEQCRSSVGAVSEQSGGKEIGFHMQVVDLIRGIANISELALPAFLIDRFSEC